MDIKKLMRLSVLSFLMVMTFQNVAFSQKAEFIFAHKKHTKSKGHLIGNGKVLTKTYSIKSFNRLKIDGVFNVYIKQGSVESMKIETDENLFKTIQVVNTYDKLILSMKKGISIKKKTKMNIYLTVKNISELEIDGVGNIKTQSALNLDNLSLEISGVGNVNLEITCNQLGASISSVGNVKLRGSAKRVVMKNSSVGNINTLDLVAQKLSIETLGVGNVKVRAEEELEIESSGIGKICYAGNAEVKRLKCSGIGKVKHCKK